MGGRCLFQARSALPWAHPSRLPWAAPLAAPTSMPRPLSSLCSSLLSLLAAAMPACTRTATPASPEVTIPSAPRAAPEPGAPGPDALVWVDEGEGKLRTIRLAASPDGYRRVGDVAALLVSDGTAVWRWIETPRHLKTVPCEGLGSPPGKGTAVQVEALRLGSTERVTVVKAPDDEGGANELTQTATPVGSVGPYLFVREWTYAYACGAHGETSVSAFVWDLAARKAVEILRPDERSAAEGEGGAEARKRFAAEGDVPQPSEEVGLVASLPRYVGGGLRLDHVFRTSACYACSTGDWGSYFRAVAVAARGLPERLRAYAEPPAVVSAFLRANPTAKMHGWSTLPAAALPALETALHGGE
jgi:hypothetical protein